MTELKYNSMSTDKEPSDRLTRDYGTILRESAILTSFAGFLFGFLIIISINSANNFILVNKIILLVAISSITVSISLFIMPVIYHHLEYPYIDLEKFKKRSHRFTLYGLVPAMLTLFLGIELSMTALLGSNTMAYLLGTIPFILVGIFYKLRK